MTEEVIRNCIKRANLSTDDGDVGTRTHVQEAESLLIEKKEEEEKKIKKFTVNPVVKVEAAEERGGVSVGVCSPLVS